MINKYSILTLPVYILGSLGLYLSSKILSQIWSLIIYFVVLIIALVMFDYMFKRQYKEDIKNRIFVESIKREVEQYG